MKILHIIPTYLPSVNSRGVIDAIHFLNKELVQRGIDVSVYTTDLDGAGGRLNIPMGKEVNIDGVKVFYFSGSFPRIWFYSSNLRSVLRSHVKDFDLIHITSVWLAISLFGAHYALKYGKPYVISPHGSLMNDPMSRRSIKKFLYLALIERWNLKRAAAIHCTTEVEAKDCRRLFPNQKIFVAPNIIQFQSDHVGTQAFREKYGISKEEKIVLFLGRLHPIKGFDTLIPSFAEVVKQMPSAKLVIAGGDEGGYKREIGKLIIKNKLRNHVVFTGELIGEEKREAFRGTDVFVLPSYSENFGMAVAEAMHFGIPVIVTSGVGIAPDIEKAQAGFIVQKDAHQVAEAILKVLNNPELGRKMGEKGKMLVMREFSASAIAEKWIAVYTDLIKR